MIAARTFATLAADRRSAPADGEAASRSDPAYTRRVGGTDSQIAGFIGKFDTSVAKLIRACRAALRKRFPTAVELVYDNYNFFVIGYCSTPRASDCVVSIAADAKGVSLSFYYGAALPDPHKRLSGNGSQNRFVRLPSAATIAEPEVVALIDAAAKQAKVAMPATGRGTTIVQSVSAKQRPRR